MANGDGTRNLTQECYDKAVQELALTEICKIKTAIEQEFMSNDDPYNLYTHLHGTIDFDQLCEDVALKMRELTNENPSLIGKAE